MERLTGWRSLYDFGYPESGRAGGNIQTSRSTTRPFSDEDNDGLSFIGRGSEYLGTSSYNAALVKLDDITPAITKEELLSLRAFMNQVFVDRTLLQYIALIVQQTRTSKAVYLGASHVHL